jgi:hypothetical protein
MYIICMGSQLGTDRPLFCVWHGSPLYRPKMGTAGVYMEEEWRCSYLVICAHEDCIWMS